MPDLFLAAMEDMQSRKAKERRKKGGGGGRGGQRLKMEAKGEIKKCNKN